MPILTVRSGLQYARLNAGEVLDQESSQEGTYCFLVQVLRKAAGALLYSCIAVIFAV